MTREEGLPLRIYCISILACLEKSMVLEVFLANMSRRLFKKKKKASVCDKTTLKHNTSLCPCILQISTYFVFCYSSNFNPLIYFSDSVSFFWKGIFSIILSIYNWKNY